ncbi:MAG: hypothetical protein AAF772_11025 [Acidobacteriota bacterium]
MGAIDTVTNTVNTDTTIQNLDQTIAQTTPDATTTSPLSVDGTAADLVGLPGVGLDSSTFSTPQIDPSSVTMSASDLIGQTPDPFADGVLDQLAEGDFSALEQPVGQVFNESALAELTAAGVDPSKPLGEQIPDLVGGKLGEAALEKAQEVLGDAFPYVAGAAYGLYQFATGGEVAQDFQLGGENLNVSGEAFVDFGEFSVDNLGVRDGQAAFSVGDEQLGASGQANFSLDTASGFTFGGANGEFHAQDAILGGDVNATLNVDQNFNTAWTAGLSDAQAFGGTLNANVAGQGTQIGNWDASLTDAPALGGNLDGSIAGTGGQINSWQVAGQEFDVLGTDNAQFQVNGDGQGITTFNGSVSDIPFVADGNLDLSVDGNAREGQVNWAANAQDMQILNGDVTASIAGTNGDLTSFNVTGQNFDVFNTDNAQFTVNGDGQGITTFDASANDIPFVAQGNLDLAVNGNAREGQVNWSANAQDLQVLGGEIDASVAGTNGDLTSANVTGTNFDVFNTDNAQFSVNADGQGLTTWDASANDIPIFADGNLDLAANGNVRDSSANWSATAQDLNLDGANLTVGVNGGTGTSGVNLTGDLDNVRLGSDVTLTADVSTNTADLLGGTARVGLDGSNWEGFAEWNGGTDTATLGGGYRPDEFTTIGGQVSTNGDFQINYDRTLSEDQTIQFGVGQQNGALTGTLGVNWQF